MRKEIYNHQENFINWMEKIDETQRIEGLNKEHSFLVISLIKDFKIGINVSIASKKGGRGYHRLNSLKQKIIFILKLLEKREIDDVTKITEKEIHQLFNDMREGVIKTRQGTPYKSTGDYVKEFKTFWHWYQKVSKKKKEIIEDITENLDRRGEKPKFVYFTKEDFEKILNQASYDLKPLIALAFDSGMRVTELLNIKISDFLEDFKEINIREESSKTFGRRMKLMICSQQIKEYAHKLELKSDDFLTQKTAQVINKELNNLGKRILTSEQIQFKNLTLYDFRHSSACFWLPRYKSEASLKWRFGWKKTEMIHYYTEFLGMKDTIKEEDLYVDITKTELEKELKEVKKRLKILEMGLIDQATKQNSTIIIQTPNAQADFSTSGTYWHDDKKFRLNGEY